MSNRQRQRRVAGSDVTKGHVACVGRQRCCWNLPQLSRVKQGSAGLIISLMVFLKLHIGKASGSGIEPTSL